MSDFSPRTPPPPRLAATGNIMIGGIWKDSEGHLEWNLERWGSGSAPSEVTKIKPTFLSCWLHSQGPRLERKTE